MLWLVMWISAILFAVNLVQFVEWGIRYVNVEILHRSGTVLHGFEKYGKYSLIFLGLIVICVILLNIIKKRVYTICCPVEKYQILKYEEKDETFFSERSFLVGYLDKSGQIKYIDCPESASKVYFSDEENPYILITEEIRKTPKMIEEILTLYSCKLINYEIRIMP